MDGYILLSDGTRLDGKLAGARTTAVGSLAANTAVVGFQEMLTDPTYQGRILVFTYPEIGNVGVAGVFSESPQVQVSGLVVKVLSNYRSHYLSEDSLENLLVSAGVPCLTDIDTRGLAVHMREHGEMAAAIVPADVNPKELKAKLAKAGRPEFRPTECSQTGKGSSGPTVAVLNLGVRRSLLEQLALCSRPVVMPCDASPDEVLAAKPAGLFVSDGPGAVVPPDASVRTVKSLLGRLPILGCGLGHVALGMALGCKPAFLRRGHHGANYPVRNLASGKLYVTQQRHTVMLDRDSVEGCREVELLCENMNDSSVEGIRARKAKAVGLQSTLAAAHPGVVNPDIEEFVNGL